MGWPSLTLTEFCHNGYCPYDIFFPNNYIAAVLPSFIFFNFTVSTWTHFLFWCTVLTAFVCLLYSSYVRALKATVYDSESTATGFKVIYVSHNSIMSQ